MSFQISPISEPSRFMKKLTFMLSKFVQVFLPCYYGNKVSTASENISNSLFSSKWIDKGKKHKLSLMISLENSKKCIKITTFGGFFAVDILTFNSICNAAYSLFALFKKVNGK